MMRAMVLHQQKQRLRLETRPVPEPGDGEVRIRVRTCAVCRTDLHVVDGDLAPRKMPVVPGHEVIGVVDAVGDGVGDIRLGERVGVPWLASACGRCDYCLSGRENLCAAAEFTGYSKDGGFADYVVADARFCFPIPDGYDDVAAAPLMCAGLIGYRSYLKAGDARRIGLYGFGAAAHIIAQIAVHQGRDVFAFTKPGDTRAQAFARSLGVRWAGGSDDAAPDVLDAAIIFAPVGALVPVALRAVDKGGRVVCAGIHMSDIPSFPYRDLWEERSVLSVANLTRSDGIGFLREAAHVRIAVETHTYPLEAVNDALDDLRAGRFEGAAVLQVCTE